MKKGLPIIGFAATMLLGCSGQVGSLPQDSAVSMVLQLFREVPAIPTSLVSLAVIIAVTLWGAGRAVEQREYVLEQ